MVGDLYYNQIYCVVNGEILALFCFHGILHYHKKPVKCLCDQSNKPITELQFQMFIPQTLECMDTSLSFPTILTILTSSYLLS